MEDILEGMKRGLKKLEIVERIKTIQTSAFLRTSRMLYKCGMIIFILSFFVSYILSFGLVRLWTVRLLVQVFMLACRGCGNHKCHNKKTQMVNGTGVWMTSCPEVMIWEFWRFLKKAELRFEPGRAQSSWGLRDVRRVWQRVEIGLWARQFSLEVDGRTM